MRWPKMFGLSTFPVFGRSKIFRKKTGVSNCFKQWLILAPERARTVLCVFLKYMYWRPNHVRHDQKIAKIMSYSDIFVNLFCENFGTFLAFRKGTTVVNQFRNKKDQKLWTKIFSFCIGFSRKSTELQKT